MNGLESEEKIDLSEQGLALFELLLSIALIAIVSLGLAKNAISAIHIARKTEINYIASNLALSKVEELAALNSADLDSSYNSTESNVTAPGTSITFTRTTTVTVNADDSREISVSVTSNNTVVSTTVDFSTKFALWE